MKKASEQSAWLTVARWLLLSMGSLVMGYLLIRVLTDPFGGKGNPITGSVLVLFVLGLILPTAQWIVVRHWLPDAHKWLATSLAGVALMAGIDGGLGSLGYFPNQASHVVGMSIAFGVAVGTAQWTYLRHHVPKAGWWIVASTLGWGAMSSATGAVIEGFAEQLLFGLIPAAFTGIAFVVLVHGRRLEASGADPTAI